MQYKCKVTVIDKKVLKVDTNEREQNKIAAAIKNFGGVSDSIY